MNKLLVAAVLIIPVLSGLAFSQACDPIKCASKSGITGSTFCRDDNVYSVYVDYYCASNECVTQTSDKLIEQCSSGCSLGTCDVCDETACKAQSGFYGSNFCRDNDVRGMYRDYSCTFREGCTFTETERTVETCKDSTCTGGKCGLCDPSVCNSQDGFYDDQFCGSDSNAYKPFRDYSCDLDRCVYKQKDIKIANCAFGCDSGQCSMTLCDAGCESRNGFAGQPYCKGNDAYRKYRSYFCSFNSCDFNETETKIDSCSGSCKSGSCASAFPPAISKERFIEFNLSFSNLTEDVKISRSSEKAYNGILFGKNDVDINADAFVESVSFEVAGTNKLGTLELFIDGRPVLNSTSNGVYTVSVDKNVKSIRLSSTSSGMVFWVPARYDLGKIEINAKKTRIKDNKFSFVLGPEFANFRSGEMISLPENVTVLLNGNTVKNVLEKDFLDFDNEIIFSAKKAGRGRALLRLEYAG